MKLSEFAEILEQAGLPVTYRAYQEGNVPDMPYLVYFESNPIVNSADNKRNHEIKSVVVELAFERKDEDLEERLEELWSNHELFFYHLSSPSRYLTKNILSSIVKIRKLFYFGLKFSVK
ncbi:hypothetical protein RFK91_09895, partial [Streptococcus suis]|uniref:hypothetical protein n=2 Tax=Streptococcus suis TaxID=1307 RepID=UPI002FCC917A